MNKCKFASLIMLSAFMAGIASSSAVSVQGDKSLVKIVNEDSKSYGGSVDMNSKVCDEAESNNLKNMSIEIGIVVIAILLVYLAICRNLENKLKKKIIAIKDNFLKEKAKKLGLLLGYNDEGKNKVRLDSFFEELCHYDIFALRRLNNLINEYNDENIVLFIIIYSIKSHAAGLLAKNDEYKMFFSKVVKIIDMLDQNLLKEFFDIIKEELNDIEEKTV